MGAEMCGYLDIGKLDKKIIKRVAHIDISFLSTLKKLIALNVGENIFSELQGELIVQRPGLATLSP